MRRRAWFCRPNGGPARLPDKSLQRMCRECHPVQGTLRYILNFDFYERRREHTVAHTILPDFLCSDERQLRWHWLLAWPALENEFVPAYRTEMEACLDFWRGHFGGGQSADW